MRAQYTSGSIVPLSFDRDDELVVHSVMNCQDTIAFGGPFPHQLEFHVIRIGLLNF